MCSASIATDKAWRFFACQTASGWRRLAVTLGLAAAGLFATAAQANITVTTLDDSGAGSLRAAIEQANLTPEQADTIVFSINGTIALNSMLPIVTAPLTSRVTGLAPPSFPAAMRRGFSSACPTLP